MGPDGIHLPVVVVAVERGVLPQWIGHANAGYEVRAVVAVVHGVEPEAFCVAKKGFYSTLFFKSAQLRKIENNSIELNGLPPPPLC